jgi:hypothetical protein
MVVWGLAAELIAFGFSFLASNREIDGLNKSNLVLQGRVSANELAAKRLEIQLVETKIQLANAQANLISLQNANFPMNIGFILDFAMALIEFPDRPLNENPKVPIKLRTLANDKSHKTADELTTAFHMLHVWLVVDRHDIGEIGQSGIIIGYRPDDELSKKHAARLMEALTSKNVPSKMMTDDIDLLFKGIPTNGLIVVVCNRPDPLNEKLMLAEAKKQLMQNDLLETQYRKMWDLSMKKFVPNSKELQDAQTEYNQLSQHCVDLQKQTKSLDELEAQIKREIDTAEFGTNANRLKIGTLLIDPNTGMPVVPVVE